MTAFGVQLPLIGITTSGQLRSCTFSIRAGGQCPPYERISFLSFNFRNKTMVQDLSQRMTGNFSLPAVYANAVRKAGGRPILLPPEEPDPGFFLKLVDGLVFSGGGDIDPAAYNGSPHPSIYNIDFERDAFEITLANTKKLCTK